MHSIKHVSVVLNVLCRMWSEAWDGGVMLESGDRGERVGRRDVGDEGI